MASKPHISIVIPARNASRTLAACLESIFSNIPAGGFEVIVVDNGSTDGTASISEGFGVTTLHAPDVFVSQVRNIGAREATTSLLAFVDSDCVLTPGWHRAVLETFQRPDVGVAGSKHDLPDDPAWCERVWHGAHSFARPPGIYDVKYVPAGNLIIRASIFDSVGGFDAALETGEDPDLCLRVAGRGDRIVENAEIRCIHLGNPKTLWQVFRRERWHGRGLRLRYSDGNLAPIAFSTLGFGLFVLLALAGAVAGLIRGSSGYSLLLMLPLTVPLVHTVAKSGRQDPMSSARLFLVYLFYFLGRSASLPYVMWRAATRAISGASKP